MKTIVLQLGLAIIISFNAISVSAVSFMDNDDKNKKEKAENTVEEAEPEMEIEPWMLHLEEFNQFDGIEESEIPIEDWMLDINEWNQIEEEQALESWMLSNTSDDYLAFKSIEQEMEVEDWMLN